MAPSRAVFVAFALVALVAAEAARTSYRPVFLMHGFSFTGKDGTNHDWDAIVAQIRARHPGQLAVAIDAFNGDDSRTEMWTQTRGVAELVAATVAADPAAFAHGYHFVGHSQGGLLLRAVLETMDAHRVHTFVSLAGVQGGIYGVPEWLRRWIGELPAHAASAIFYLDYVQRHLSLADYWKDPLDLPWYRQQCLYLPVLNNLAPGNFSARYRANFLRVAAMHAFGSPQDDTVTPWQSELFGYWKPGSESETVPMQKLPEYTSDSFGLRSLDERGDLHLHAVAGVHHAEWVRNASLFVEYVLPLLE